MKNSQRMPTLFIGHGSPMNAIQKNSFTNFLRTYAENIPRPKAILAVSAHWQTPGTKVLRAEKPRTIHDFYGFPKELFAIQYPASGAVPTAEEVVRLLEVHDAEADSSWGLDHGTWSLLHHLYPSADIPVLQLSLNQNLNMKEHLELAKELVSLRDQGVLILGSGNITHNLRNIDWDERATPMDWAVEFDELIKKALLEGDRTMLTASDPKLHSLWRQAHPTIEHYLPLLYVVGASSEERLTFPYEGMQNGSLSMRAARFG